MVEVVVTSQADKYKQKIVTEKHALFSDASPDVGGGDTGPDPHELLLGALGACTSITVQMFAGRRGWDLKEVHVHLSEEKVDNPDEPGRQMSKITRTVSVKGDLSPDQIDALKVAADKCLIHKLLIGPKTIETTVSVAN